MRLDHVRYVVPLPPAELRGNARAQWAQRNRAADSYSEVVVATILGGHDIWECAAVPCAHCIGLGDGGPATRVAVTYTWRYAGSRPDLDNIARGVKVLQDTLCCAPERNAGRNRWYLDLILDDGEIEPVTFRREKVKHRAEEGVVVEIDVRR